MIEPCPECKTGKHWNCDGLTWDEDTDTAVPCPCFTNDQEAHEW